MSPRHILQLDCSLRGAIGLHYAHLRLGLGLGLGLVLGLGVGVGLALVFSERHKSSGKSAFHPAVTLTFG